MTSENPSTYPTVARTLASRARSARNQAEHWRGQIERREQEIAKLRAYIAQLEQEATESYEVLAELGYARQLDEGDWVITVPDPIDELPHPNQYLTD